MPASGPDNQSLVLSQLRDADIDRYLAVLLSPEPARRPLAALYAYHAELARVRDVVREPLPGEVRLQYWRDLLEGAEHGSTHANPLAAELVEAIRLYKLPTAPLVAMSEARIFDLYDDPMDSVANFEGYAGETASALIQLASLVLDPAEAAGQATTAGHAGVAQAVAGALLLLPLHRSRGQVYLPAEILMATGLDRDAFLNGADKARLHAAIEAFAGYGLDHLDKAMAAGARLSPVLAPAYLPLALARPILRRAARDGSAAVEGRLRAPQWVRQLRMLALLWTRSF